MKQSKIWVCGFLFIILLGLSLVIVQTVRIDPFFHYHYPDTQNYFYALNNERSQNDGITKFFDYQGILTGTSMTENFKATEATDLFDIDFIKIPYAGASYKEVNDGLKAALAYHPDMQIIIRGLDMNMFFDDKDYMDTSMGEFPLYMTDQNIFNDVKYVFNRDVVLKRVYQMMRANDAPDFQGGITSFDAYSNWMKRFPVFGPQQVFPDGPWTVQNPPAPSALFSLEDQKTVLENIRQNVSALAKGHPEVTFYCFFPPYSAAWWGYVYFEGRLDRQIQAERLIIEELLQYDNIKLFSFNNLTDITTDLNNYRDILHYGEWINSLILQYMHDDICRLTADNYERYLAEEYDFYSNFDYTLFSRQDDYENEYYAAALLNEQISGVSPISLNLTNISTYSLSHAQLVDDSDNHHSAILCTGTLQKPVASEDTLSEYLYSTDYIGLKYTVPDISSYRYLVFDGKKVCDHGQPVVCIYDATGTCLRQLQVSYHQLDEQWHQQVFDISGLSGEVTIILHGGYIDETGDPDSQFMFRDIFLY